MKNLELVATFFLVLALSPKTTPQDDNQQTLMKAAQENIKPDKMHQLLYEIAGSWNGKVKRWLQDNMPPLEFTTESTCEKIDNELHLTRKTTGSIMEMPYTGHEHFGYNNPIKKFFLTWIHNLSSGIQYVEGNYDETTKTITYTGNTTDPLAQPIEIQFTKKPNPKALAQNYKLADLEFLQGKWKVENKETYETWKLNTDNTLTGSSYKVKDGKEVVSENLSIITSGDKIVYTATVLNQNSGKPVEFTLNKEISTKASFENLNHDFPKKIQYTKLDDKTLFVEVLGKGDRGFSFKMMKQ